MKILVTDRKDKTLYCLDASEILYNPNSKQIWLRGYGTGCSEICITDVDAEKGKNIVECFFDHPKLDLRDREAYINETPPSDRKEQKAETIKDLDKYKHNSIYRSKFI